MQRLTSTSNSLCGNDFDWSRPYSDGNKTAKGTSNNLIWIYTKLLNQCFSDGHQSSPVVVGQHDIVWILAQLCHEDVA